MWLPGSSTRPKRVPNGTRDPLGHPSSGVFGPLGRRWHPKLCEGAHNKFSALLGLFF